MIINKHKWHYQFQSLLYFSSLLPFLWFKLPSCLPYSTTTAFLFLFGFCFGKGCWGVFTYHKVYPLYVYISMIFSKFTDLYNHHLNPVLEHLHTFKEISHVHLQLISISPFLRLQAVTNLLSVSLDLPFWVFHINGIT